MRSIQRSVLVFLLIVSVGRHGSRIAPRPRRLAFLCRRRQSLRLHPHGGHPAAGRELPDYAGFAHADRPSRGQQGGDHRAGRVRGDAGLSAGVDRGRGEARVGQDPCHRAKPRLVVRGDRDGGRRRAEPGVRSAPRRSSSNPASTTGWPIGRLGYEAGAITLLGEESCTPKPTQGQASRLSTR